MNDSVHVFFVYNRREQIFRIHFQINETRTRFDSRDIGKIDYQVASTATYPYSNIAFYHFNELWLVPGLYELIDNY